MSKNNYSITYLDSMDTVRYFDVSAYTERQAIFVFYKLVRHTVQNIIQVNRY